jgi:hypothetical protein
MSLKTIKVNPIFLMGAGGSSSGGGGSSSKNKTRKEKPLGVSLGQSNNIKKKLIARIKNFQQGAGTGASASTGASTGASASTVGASTGIGIGASNFTNEFSESVSFLNNLARDKQVNKAEKRNNNTLKKKQPRNEEAYMQIATELPPELLGGVPLQPPFAGKYVATPPASGGVGSFFPGGVAPSPASGGVGLAERAGFPPGGTPMWSAPPQPSYSNLKTGGTKPTYRTWLRNTQKNKHISPVNKPPINILEDTGIASPTITFNTAPTMQPSVPTGLAQTAAALAVQVPTATAQVQEAVQEAVQTAVETAVQAIQTINTEPFPSNASPSGVTEIPNGGRRACVAGGFPPTPKRKKITRTLKYKLGKHANGKVSVLIKNSQTRRRVQTEHAQLKQKSILDIKNHLRSKNLLKVGSEAPNDVLRHIYEQSILAGQIENKAKETLIHNYFNEEKK